MNEMHVAGFIAGWFFGQWMLARRRLRNQWIPTSRAMPPFNEWVLVRNDYSDAQSPLPMSDTLMRPRILIATRCAAQDGCEFHDAEFRMVYGTRWMRIPK